VPSSVSSSLDAVLSSVSFSLDAVPDLAVPVLDRVFYFQSLLLLVFSMHDLLLDGGCRSLDSWVLMHGEFSV
jgi:hypothetical protein